MDVHFFWLFCRSMLSKRMQTTSCYYFDNTSLITNCLRTLSMHCCCVFHCKAVRECRILIVTPPKLVFRGLLLFLSCTKFLFPRKSITFFPNRLSWCSIFLVIKILIQLWDLELVNIHEVWKSMIHTFPSSITYKRMLCVPAGTQKDMLSSTACDWDRKSVV